MTQKHTPGPWFVRPPQSNFNKSPTIHPATPYAAHLMDFDVTIATINNKGTKTAERAANAALIASAPDLLEAAKAAMEYDNAICACANDPAKMASFCSAAGEDLDTLYDRWMSLSAAAIAKAEGR